MWLKFGALIRPILSFYMDQTVVNKEKVSLSKTLQHTMPLICSEKKIIYDSRERTQSKAHGSLSEPTHPSTDTMLSSQIYNCSYSQSRPCFVLIRLPLDGHSGFTSQSHDYITPSWRLTLYKLSRAKLCTKISCEKVLIDHL